MPSIELGSPRHEAANSEALGRAHGARVQRIRDSAAAALSQPGQEVTPAEPEAYAGPRPEHIVNFRQLTTGLSVSQRQAFEREHPGAYAQMQADSRRLGGLSRPWSGFHGTLATK